MILTRRFVLCGLLAAPAVIAADRLMPVRNIARLLEPYIVFYDPDGKPIATVPLQVTRTLDADGRIDYLMESVTWENNQGTPHVIGRHAAKTFFPDMCPGGEATIMSFYGDNRSSVHVMPCDSLRLNFHGVSARSMLREKEELQQAQRHWHLT